MTPGSALSWKRLGEAGWDAAALAFNRCYEGYLIPVRMEAAPMAARFAAEDLDPAASWIVHSDGEPAALGFVARRGDRSRLAAFGVAPAWRGTGVARTALRRLIEEAQAREDCSMELEVFVQNPAAVRLYEKAGFAAVDRLLGFEKASEGRPVPVRPAPTPEPVPLSALPSGIADEASLPWQLQPASLMRLPAQWQLLRDGEHACAIVDMSGEAVVQLRLLHTAPDERRRGHARRTLDLIERQAAGRPIRVAQLIPSAFENFARRLGFRPLETMQLRMQLDFPSR